MMPKNIFQKKQYKFILVVKKKIKKLQKKKKKQIKKKIKINSPKNKNVR